VSLDVENVLLMIVIGGTSPSAPDTTRPSAKMAAIETITRIW
jgi:hypothetical protein